MVYNFHDLNSYLSRHHGIGIDIIYSLKDTALSLSLSIEIQYFRIWYVVPWWAIEAGRSEAFLAKILCMKLW